MITSELCRMVHGIVVDGGAAAMFNRHMRGPGGPRPGFDRSVYLIGWLLTVIAKRRSHIRAIHKTLTREVPLEWQQRWGVRWQVQLADGTSEWNCLREQDLQNVSKRFKRVYNYTTNHVPDHSEPGDREEVRQRNYRELTALMDALIRATLPPRPDGAADYAMDSTGLWATERSRRAIPTKPTDTDTDTETETETDADADPGLGPEPGIEQGHEAAQSATIATEARTITTRSTATRRPRVRGRSDARFGGKTGKNGGTEWYYGYEGHALVRIAAGEAAGQPDEPQLIEALRMTPAGTDIVRPSLEILDAVLATGQPIRYLMVDRHYSYKQYQRWQRPLLERGIKQVCDLRADQTGFDEWDGALMAAGVPHCPGTPTRLGAISSPGLPPMPFAPAHERDAYAKRRAQFAADIAERRAYATTRHAPLDPTGSSRWICPAAAGTVGCALRPGTVSTATALGLPIVASPPAKDDAPRMCTQATFSLRVQTQDQERVMKQYQDLYWGSPEHQALYGKRTYVEGFFGTLKGDNAAGKNRGTSLYTGLAHESLEAATFAVAANIRTLRTWHRKTGLGDPANPILHTEPEDIITAPITIDDYQRLLDQRATQAA